MTMNDIPSLIAEGASLKATVEALQSRLREVNAALAEFADFPEGRNTARIAGAGYEVKIQRRENVKWDQAKLEAVREAMGNDEFFSVFAWKFEPKSKKALDGFLGYGDPSYASMIEDARTVSAGAPQVTYEPIDQEGEE